MDVNLRSLATNGPGEASEKQKRGAFIVFEGTDRSGKSTQAKLLVEEINKLGLQKATYVRFPDRETDTGQMLDNYLVSSVRTLPKQMIHLLFTLNRWEKHGMLNQLLSEGTTVICDRYSYSGIAYSVAALELDFEWCKLTEAGLLCPDVVFYMYIDPKLCLERNGYGCEIYEKIVISEKVSQVYNSFSKERYWMPICAMREIKDIHKDILAEALHTINQVESDPLSSLWN